MSEPIRYSEVSNDWNGEAAGLAPSADGEWVKYDDYAAATQWRPIETAPKDGTKVLLFSGYITTAGWYSHQSYEGNETVWECGASLVYGPTHWMPLPKPPAV